MCCFSIVFPSPCKDCKESDNFLTNLFLTLWKQLVTKLPKLCDDSISNALPEQLFVPPKHLIQLLLPLDTSETCGEKREICETGWFNLAEIVGHSLLLDSLTKQLNAVRFNGFDYAEIIAEQLHNIADSKPDICHSLNIYWLTCGHPPCIESSDNIPLHGALRRLEMWNQASITFVCPTNDLGESEFTDPWFSVHRRYVTDQNEKMPQDHNVVWQGYLECLANEQTEENWRLSRLLCQSQPSVSSLLSGKDDKFSVGKTDVCVLAEGIKVICEMHKDVVPFWKIFPSQFLLYHKSLLKRVFQIQGTEGLDFEEICKDKENVVLASIATYDRKYSVRAKTTKDWMEYICSGSEIPQNEKLERCPVKETFHLVLYPIEAGIFLAYFFRPDDAFIELQSLLTVYQALFPHNGESTVTETSQQYEECQEQKWLQLLDLIESSQRSPLKSEFSLAVHLDASEMLKHFTKDGKPIKKELKSLLKKIEEKRQLVSMLTQEEKTEDGRGRKPGVDYCCDRVLPTIISSSPRLHPKHETLSICNTPKTLAKAKLHDVKRRISKSETSSINVDTDPEFDASQSQNIPLEKATKAARPETSKRSSKEEKIRNPTRQDQAKRKRRSFDANKTAKPEAPDFKEKRSDRHKRRLARVVKRSLLKYGVDPTETYFSTCSERLYYLCKSFLQDLKTSEGLNDEMKRLADSNVATVVEFEKRQHASKAGGEAQSTK